MKVNWFMTSDDNLAVRQVLAHIKEYLYIAGPKKGHCFWRIHGMAYGPMGAYRDMGYCPEALEDFLRMED
jgi:hypothetical protein